MKHLACIMDGNRRWAKKHGKPTLQGHQEGLETVKRVIRFCLDKHIEHLSLYTFSLENFKRSEAEKSYLFDLIATQAYRVVQEFQKKDIRLRFIGDRSLFPKNVRSVCEEIEKETADGKRLAVNVLFCYGGQQEIVHGVKRIIEKIKSGLLSEEDIDSALFKKHLWMNGTPEPELIIRTGGHKRLSNFLSFQSAYSELCFLDCLWPELTETELEKAVGSYIQCVRNFGV